MAEKPVIGYRSSLMASFLALLILFVPFLEANYIQKVRAGEGKYAFEEEMCFDINDEEQFDNTWQASGAIGTGAFMWRYNPLVTPPPYVLHHSNVSLITVPVNGTVDGYGVSTTKLLTGDVVSSGSNYVQFLLTITKEDILEDDITRLDIYINVGGATFPTLKFILTDKSSTVDIFEKSISIGNKTKIGVEVSDILKINNLNDQEQIKLRFEATGSDIIPGNTFVVLDMQWYCVREIKVPTLTKLGYCMALTGIGLLFLGFIVSPEYTFKGVIDWLGKFVKKY